MNTDKDKLNWYVIRTMSRCEKKCLENLSKKGIEVFLPIHKVRKRWSDRIKVIEEPLFNGYIFVHIQDHQRYDVLNTSGVFNFVQFKGEFAQISELEITGIRNALTQNVDLEVVEIDLEIGEEILIKSGPFSGIYAKLIEVKNKYKILVSLEAMGQGIVVEIGKTRIEKFDQKMRKIG